MKEKLEKEMKDKSENDKKETVKRSSKKEREQDFQKAQEPDLLKIFTVLQEQVAELTAAEKARKNQEQMYYQNWYPMHYQTSQQQ